MSHYLVLLILEFLPGRLATLLYGLDSNVTQLLANLLTKPSVFYYLPIVPCNLVSIKLLLLLLLLYLDFLISCDIFVHYGILFQFVNIIYLLKKYTLSKTQETDCEI